MDLEKSISNLSEGATTVVGATRQCQGANRKRQELNLSIFVRRKFSSFALTKKKSVTKKSTARAS